MKIGHNERMAKLALFFLMKQVFVISLKKKFGNITVKASFSQEGLSKSKEDNNRNTKKHLNL